MQMLFLVLLFAAVHAPAQTGERARAILESKCMTCHGQARMSDFDMRERATLLKGGKRGPAVIPGDAKSSLLVKAVRHEGDLRMPPGKDRLSGEEAAALAEWIDKGAIWEAAGVAPSWWSFRKPVRPAVPVVVNQARVASPIDAFVFAKIEEQKGKPAPEADRRTLARRAAFDLHGLPPTPEDVDAFVKDATPRAWEKYVDRLLESPRYGERWGRYWLDLVRYADTSGFETDHFFINAWRYRDYVISSFNNDKPYDVFVKEQIAADEIWPMSTDLEGTLKLPEEKQKNLNRRIGTSLFTIGSFPIEYTYYGDRFRAEWRADAVDTVGAAFLGLTLNCARCHDHKFDPISQRDYYRMSALFAGSVESEIPLGSLFDVQTSTRNFPLLAHAQALKRMAGNRGANRTPEERAAVLQKLGEAYLRAPDRMATANVLDHETPVPDTHVLIKGEFKNKGEEVAPGFLSALHAGPAIHEPDSDLFIPRRRKALAEWLTSPENPLLARVMVNRIWQGHFGDGIVRTPNDFGRQGEAPTHPELLDWLAIEFADGGWSIKQMHRLIMTSRVYRLARTGRRLDADALRDSILAVSGALNLKMGGVGVIPPLSKEEIQAARMPQLWPTHPDPAEHNRRSIYLQMKRSLTLPMLQAFDAPDTSASCPRRETSTVAPQALALMNSGFTWAQAGIFAARVKKIAGDDAALQLETAWRLAFARTPDETEAQTALDYLRRNSLERLCLLIFNTNEFVYVD
jgi:cytochrome c553